MFTEKRVVIVVAVVLVTCALLFCNTTSVIEAAAATRAPTSITITSTTTSTVNIPFTLYGTLKSGTTPLTSQSVHLERRTYTSGAWGSWANVANSFTKTNSSGVIRLSQTIGTVGAYQYRWHFNGTATYQECYSPLLTVTVRNSATFTIATSTTTPTTGIAFTLAGTLKTGTTGLYAPVHLERRTYTSGAWGSWANVANSFTKTNSSGVIRLSQTIGTVGAYQYRWHFNGTATYQSSYSIALTETVQKPPIITVTSSTTTPAVNHPFTLSGTLTAGGTPLSGKTITLQREDPSGHWSAVNTTTTDAKGAYTFTRSESQQGTYRFEPTFAGDTYAAANVVISITVGTVQKSVLSITTDSTPDVNQPYILHGSLQDGLSGAPLAGQPIRLLIMNPSGQRDETWTTTDAKGAYTFTRSESQQGTYWEEVDFYGNSDYSVASEMLFLTIGHPTPTKIDSLTSTNVNPRVNQSFTISGYLMDINGTKLSHRTIWVNVRLPTGEWDLTEYVATDSNGFFSVTHSEQAVGLYRFEFHFMGDTTYAHCGPAVEVTVGTIRPTKISMNTNIENPKVGESFMLSGYLTDANGAPLSEKLILLGRVVVGQPTYVGDGGYFDHRYTDQNGRYSFVLNESARGTYEYIPTFFGDQAYTSSYNWIGLTVGTLAPTQLSLATSTTTPAVNHPFTLSGTLTAAGTPLSGKTITLQREDPSGHWSAVNTTTTDAKGAYTFTRSESLGIYLFAPTFAGAGAYAPASTWASITVGTLTPTTITVTSSTTTPAVNHPFTLSGTLKDKSKGTPLSGKTITLQREDPSGHWSAVNTTTTDAKGAYTFTRSESQQGTYRFEPTFAGDTYAAANVVISITVGTLA